MRHGGGASSETTNIDAIKKQMADSGIDLNDLLATLEVSSATKLIRSEAQIPDRRW